MTSTQQLEKQARQYAQRRAPIQLPADSLNITEAAEFLGMSKDKLMAWRARRFGPVSNQIGSKTFYRKATLEKWKRDHRTGGNS